MAWASLLIAGLCEMLGVAAMNMVNRRRNLQSMLLMVLAFGGSFLFMSFAMRTLPMGTAYAVWTGIGAAGGAIVGMLFFGESRDWRRIVFITMILGATVGLKLAS